MQPLTRRSLLGLSASALAWTATRTSLGTALREDLSTGWDAPRALLSTPLQVPPDFVGMHAHRWPSAPATAPTAAPSYAFGAARSHDHDGLSWNQIHLGPDHFAWDRLDRWVATHSAAGRTLVYTLYGTPAWLAQDTSRADLYGRAGGAAAPRDLAPLATFVKALLGRYNRADRRRLHLLETWNEPHFEGASRDFWWGTAAQLVALGRTVYLAAKGADPAVRVLSPGFAGDLTGGSSPAHSLAAPAPGSSLVQYLTAGDGHGATGSRWCDGLAFHTYNLALRGPNAGALQDITRLRALLGSLPGTLHGPLPLYNTECGFLPPHPFRALRPAEQARQLKRLGTLQAALGVQGLFLYSHDDDLVGNPSLHPVVAEAIGELHSTLAGATLQQVTLRADGSVHLQTQAGAFLW